MIEASRKSQTGIAFLMKFKFIVLPLLVIEWMKPQDDLVLPYTHLVTYTYIYIYIYMHISHTHTHIRDNMNNEIIYILFWNAISFSFYNMVKINWCIKLWSTHMHGSINTYSKKKYKRESSRIMKKKGGKCCFGEKKQLWCVEVN